MIDWDNYDVGSDGQMYYNYLRRFFNYEITWKELEE